MSNRLLIAVCLFATTLFSSLVKAEYPIEDSWRTTIGDGPLNAFVAKIKLPAGGIWQVREPEDANVRELYLVPTGPTSLRRMGNRMFAAMEKRQVQRDRWNLRMGFEASRRFAQENEWIGPESFADFEKDHRWKYVANRWNKGHSRIADLEDYVENPSEGPFVFLIPKVKFNFSDPVPSRVENLAKDKRLTVPKSERKLLAFELRPFVADGKHWVLFTDGSCERVDIDQELLSAHSTKVRPMISKRQIKAANDPVLDYKLVLVTNETSPDSLKLSAHNQVVGNEIQIQWNVSESKTESYERLTESISQARRFAWRPYYVEGSGGILNVWEKQPERAANNNPRRSLSMFSILGGRAAIEETLQLQNLNVIDKPEDATIDISTLKGVEVKSHPFEEMLGDNEGGKLPMADVVPADRFFVYIGKPEKISAMLDKGAPFISSAGSTFTGNCLKYNLEARYLERLGMTRDWVDAVLKSGLTTEISLFAPDLFFIDGTDVTIVAKLQQPALFKGLLGMLGATKLNTSDVLELPTQSGKPAFLALRDDLLFASTNRGELQLSIDLHERGGNGSLGQSTEFKYMLTQLPVSDQTRMFAYLSDPFVRRLVSPRVKIAQRRRVVAKAKMEAVTARALMARLDGNDAPLSIKDLVASNHVPSSWQTDGLSLDATGLVSSQHYGTLPRMRSLPEVPLDKITPQEAEAYRIYMENYDRYWRRFFDPIAVRLDDVGRDQLELSTFILPLVDNSIYNGLRSVLAHEDDETMLSTPIVEPAPVVQFSVNLKDEAWQMIAGNFSEFFTRYSGASSAMLDDLGPSLHVAVFDADPIIAMGSGDIFGAFGGNVLRAGGGNEMLMVPVALSMLTRPCSIMVETKDPELTARYLRQAALAGMSLARDRDFGVSFHQVEDRDEWVWTMDIFGVVKLRYGVEVVGKYLVIRNIPWSSNDKVVSVEPAELNAASLQANPAACNQQLPGLFAAASDANRRAVMAGLGRLYPFMLSGSESVEQAAAEHQRLFGFYPYAIGDDQWEWTDYRLTSRDYGEPTRQRQPAYSPDRPFGLMNSVDSLQLNMQFEQDGLRSSIRWRLR